MAVEGILLHSLGSLCVPDIASIRAVIAPLSAEVEDVLSLPDIASSVDGAFLKDMRRIEGAIQRLRLLLDGISASLGDILQEAP